MMYRRCFPIVATALALSSLARAQSAPTAAPINDGLNLRFANGIAAIAEDKVITVDDVRREIGNYAPQIQREARDQKDFEDRLEALQDSVIQDLIDRVLIIKEFRKVKDGKEARHIPVSFVENRIADILSEQFDNDRSKFLAYLRAKGLTSNEYKKEQEEEIIYGYMKGQQKRSQSLVSPVRIETYYRENKDSFFQEDQVHLRIIQFNRVDGITDAELKTKASDIIAKFKGGAKFEDLAREYSEGAGRTKGGDWGWFAPSQMKEEFKPAFALKKGEISEPIVMTEGGFILYAEDRKYAGTQGIDEVRDQIERILVNQMARTSQERWLERLRRNGYIKHY